VACAERKLTAKAIRNKAKLALGQVVLAEAVKKAAC